MKRTVFIAAAVALIAAFFVGSHFYKSGRAEKLGFMAEDNAETFVRPYSPTLGSEEAKVYLVKFSDPACETCAAFSTYGKQALEAYPGKVKFVLRHAPFHKGSDGVVRILEASRRQDKFWETLELLYKRQKDWTQNHRVILSRVWPLLPEVGLDVERVRSDMNDPEIARIVQQDLADARALGVRRTPGFFVNGKPLEPFGARPLVELIQSELRIQYPE
ncbi:MAG: disulfide bond formation protein DsbA [Gemmatimonadetes bacterium]|nr:disulfide bond formation protein DsbA [Gemmatimonadota bacterium]